MKAKPVSYTRNDLKSGNSKFRTQSLFWEYRVPDVPPIFTIKDEDHEVDGIIYLSLKRLYMSFDHIPGYEYDFANEVLGGWAHWLAIYHNKLFTRLIDQWRSEKEIELQAKAIKAIILTATTEGSKGHAAAKYLADKGWKGLRGRPSKEETDRAKKEELRLLDDISEDINRLGLAVVNGGKS